MATEKVTIVTCVFKNNWFNIRDNKDREISVGTVDKKTGGPVNQKLTALLNSAQEGIEVEMDLRDWQGKWFGNDVKAAGSGFGGKSFTPADKSFDAAKIAVQAAATFHSLDKDRNVEKVKEDAENLHAWIMSKVTPKA
jgi:hypothetical protein